MSCIRSRFLVGTFPTCVHIVIASHCQTTFGGTSSSTYLHGRAVEAVPHNFWSSRFRRSVIPPSRILAVTTQTPPLVTLSRVTAVPVLVWDCGKIPTKCGKSAKVCWVEQAAKAAHRQQLYAPAGLLSSSESVSSESVVPVQLPPGLKSIKSAQQTMARGSSTRFVNFSNGPNTNSECSNLLN